LWFARCEVCILRSLFGLRCHDRRTSRSTFRVRCATPARAPLSS
jgi:hypothetical protein